MSDDEPKPPRFCFAVSEMLIITAILSFLVAILLPSANFARARYGEPPSFPWLHWLLVSAPELFGWDSRLSIVVTPCVATLTLAAIIILIRRWLPHSVRRYFPFRNPQKPVRLLRQAPHTPNTPIADSRPAILTTGLAGFATVVLIVAAIHVGVDRAGRRPVLEWEGPAAEYVPLMAGVGWSFSVVAIIFGAYSQSRFLSKPRDLAFAGMGLAMLNCFASVFFLLGILED